MIPCLQETIVHNVQIYFVVQQAPTHLVLRDLSLGVERPGLEVVLYHLVPMCKLYGATPTFPHMAWCLIEDRMLYDCLRIK